MIGNVGVTVHKISGGGHQIALNNHVDAQFSFEIWVNCPKKHFRANTTERSNGDCFFRVAHDTSGSLAGWSCHPNL
jgi:hypothetical protein